MWASSQPRGNEQCLLRGAQNTLSQWNAPASQAEGSFHFFVNLGGNRVGTVNGRRGSAMWGLRLARVSGLDVLWVAAQAVAIYAVSSLNTNFPYWLVCWMVTINAWLLFRRLLG